jgi:hypothetical protein
MCGRHLKRCRVNESEGVEQMCVALRVELLRSLAVAFAIANIP